MFLTFFTSSPRPATNTFLFKRSDLGLTLINESVNFYQQLPFYLLPPLPRFGLTISYVILSYVSLATLALLVPVSSGFGGSGMLTDK